MSGYGMGVKPGGGDGDKTDSGETESGNLILATFYEFMLKHLRKECVRGSFKSRYG